MLPKPPLRTTSFKMTLQIPTNHPSGQYTWPPVGPRVRWCHRGAIQDALSGTRRTILGTGKRSPTLAHLHFALLGWHPGPTPPNQRPYRQMRIVETQRELCRNGGQSVLVPGFACIMRTEWLRHIRDTVLNKGAHLWYKGDDGLWCFGKLGTSTSVDEVYLVGFLDDPGPMKFLPRPARYKTSIKVVRGSCYHQVHVASTFRRGIQRTVFESRSMAVTVIL